MGSSRSGPKGVTWTAEMDHCLRADRQRGRNWEQIAAHVGVDRKMVLRRAKALGIPTARLSRGPIPGERVVRDNPPAALLGWPVPV